MRASGDQSKTACGNFQRCAGLEAGIEGATHAVGKRQMERLKVRWSKEEVIIIKEEESVDVEAVEERLMLVTAGTDEEAAERLEAALEMEMDGEG